MAWEKESLFFEGDDWFASLIDGIRRAASFLYLEIYILADDEVGRNIFFELTAAAARGVRVCLVVDGLGSASWLFSSREAREKRGVEVRVYHPLPLVMFRFAPHSGRGLRLVFRALRALNRRTHRKFCVVDNREIWLGSLNLAAVHSRACRGDLAWRDTGVAVAGGAVEEVVVAFLQVWRRSWRLSGFPRFERRPRALAPSGLVLVNRSRSERRRFQRELVGRIAAAKGKVWITTAYFVPSGSLVRALMTAARSGADVRILVPRHSDVAFMPWVALAFSLSLLKAGVRVYEYCPTILHAKSLLADDWCLVGSMNFNHRSFHRDLEMCVSLVSLRARHELERYFWKDLANSQAITEDKIRGQPLWQRLVARFILFFQSML